MGEFSVELQTGNRFWTPKGLGAMGMDPHRAIAELVANSLDWRRVLEDNIESFVQIVIGKSFIQITDNGVGMTESELVNALQLSVSNDSLRQNLRIRKGMFGMGMKVACLTLGWKFEIHTRSLQEDNIEACFTLDSRLLDNDGNNNEYRKALKGKTKTFDDNSPISAWQSGTSILISDLTHKSLSAVAIKDSLQEIFSPEIGIEGVKIEVVDAVTSQVYICEKTVKPIFEQSKIVLDDLNLFVLVDDKTEPIQIRGWIGLLKTAGSGSGEWGLHLFKNNQIIERYHQLPKRLGGLMPKNPHPMYARTYGEIHLDMCSPAFHKVGFDYSTESWIDVQKLLLSHIEIVMNASKDYKKSDFEKAELSIRSIQQHTRAAKRAINILTENDSVVSEDIPDVPNFESLVPVKSDLNFIELAINNEDSSIIDDTVKVPVNAINLRDGQWFTIVEPIFDELVESQINKPWIYHFKKESQELAIIINIRSPIYQSLSKFNFELNQVQIVVNWSISDCILQLLYQKFYYNLNESLDFRDQQLSKLFHPVEAI
jgi:hypothetical protein